MSDATVSHTCTQGASARRSSPGTLDPATARAPIALLRHACRIQKVAPSLAREPGPFCQ